MTVHTGRVGLAARAGHDLEIEVERWNATLELSPDDPSQAKLRATADAASLRVREGHGGVKPLTDSDRAEIQRNIADKVLASARYPEVRFESTSIQGADLRMWRIEGRLTMHGATVPVEITVHAEPGGTETLLRASCQVVQSSFGIKPYRGMMGALKVADAVEVRAEARLPLGNGAA
jgi:polyisoprenoid-binding protein YceI